MHSPATYLLLAATLFLSACSDETTIRTDKPTTRATASTQLVDFPFPSSARSIYYLIYAGRLQEMENYFRFDVDPQQLDSSVDALVAWNNKQMRRALAYPRTPLSSAAVPAPNKKFLPMPWWDPATIATGYYRGHGDADALRILVDETRSRVYVHQNDKVNRR